MSKDLPSIDDFAEDNSNLPSINDFITEENAEELPSVEDFIEKEEEVLTEATQTIEDAEGNSFAEVKDIIPPWPELVKMVNDVRADIPDIPEIKYYDKELEELAEQISNLPEVRYYDREVEAICEQIDFVREQVKDLPEVKYYDEQVDAIEDRIDNLQTEVANLPEVKYYDSEIEAICEAIDQVKASIPKFPKWVNEVNEVPDFSWIGKTFSIIDDDFVKVNDTIEGLRGKVQFDLEQLSEDVETKHFNNTIKIENDISKLNEKVDTRIDEEKDKIWKELRSSSLKMWEYHKEFKDDDRKLKKQILGEYNTLKQNINKELKEINYTSTKTDELLLKYFTELREEISELPEVKYYDKDIDYVKSDIKGLYKIVEEIKSSQKQLKEEQKLLAETNVPLGEDPPETDNPDPLTPIDQNFVTLDQLQKHYKIFVERVQYQLSSIGGGGAGFIKDLDDVDISGLADNYILQYDAATSKWLTVANNAGAGGTWASNAIGINTTKNVGIGTTSAKSDKALYVVGDVETTGNITVGGTITYEDVTNVDSVGLGTFRNGLEVQPGTATTALLVQGDARVTGILTIGTGSITLDPNARRIKGVDELLIGDDDKPITIKKDEKGEIKFEDKDGKESSVGIGTTVSINTTGIITATTFVGDGSQLSNIISGVGIQSESVRVGTGFTDINFTGAGITITGSGTTVTVDIPSSTITRQTETSSGVTTDFTITGGYTVGFIDVYLNGVKQRSGVDFTASDGSTVTMTPFISDGDVVEFQKYDNFKIASVTNATNAYNIVGTDFSLNTSGIITASQLAVSGLSTSKDLLVTGITSATNLIEIKSNDSTPGRIDLYCETNNAHYARLQAPEHGDFSGNITVKLPASTGTLLLSDGSGASLTSLNASNLGSGTIPDARFPATLPAISGQNLTGIVTGITAGSNITVLESPSGNFIITATGGGGGGTVSINASAGDILSASSGEISADDAGSDKLVFWDDSESKLTYLTAGSGLSISGNIITASGGGGSSGVEIENNGTSVGTGITAINFSTNVTATASGGIATVTASGGGGGSDGPSSVMMGMIF